MEPGIAAAALGQRRDARRMRLVAAAQRRRAERQRAVVLTMHASNAHAWSAIERCRALDLGRPRRRA